MKKAIVYLACVFIVSSAGAMPGSKIIKTFDETFPNAKNVKWADDKEGYYVSFKQNGNFTKVLYNKQGEFVYSIKYETAAELPTNIALSLNKAVGQADILGVTEVTTPTDLVYNVKLTKENKLYNINVQGNGRITKQEEFINSTATNNN